MKLFIRFRSSLVDFLGLIKYTIIAPANGNSLNSSFPICIPLISSCCLVALDRTTSTILNMYGESLVYSLILVGLLQLSLHLF